MNDAVERYFRRLGLGREVTSGPLTVVPLFSPDDCALSYVALGPALEAGTLTVQEVTSSGVVGTLQVRNTGDLPVLLLDGEELAGAKQNRVLNITILVEAHSEMTIPVSCTEHGRWAYSAARFTESEAHAPPRIRRLNVRAVSASLASNGVASGDQMGVWNEVERLSFDAGVESPTRAMRDVYQSRRTQLDETLDAIPCARGQVGMLAVASSGVLGFDIVSRWEVYSSLHRKLVRSYAMDAMLNPASAGPAQPLDAAREFVGAALKATEQRFASTGCGDSFRYAGPALVGSALAWEGCLVHAGFFSTPPGEDGTSLGRMGACSARMEFRRDRAREADPRD